MNEEGKRKGRGEGGEEENGISRKGELGERGGIGMEKSYIPTNVEYSFLNLMVYL